MNLLIAVIGLFGFLHVTSAEETLGEKTQVQVNAAARDMKKGVHRTKEAVCGKLTGDSKAACLAKKAKNRMIEAKDVIKDKATELKDVVDTEKK